MLEIWSPLRNIPLHLLDISLPHSAFCSINHVLYRFTEKFFHSFEECMLSSNYFLVRVLRNKTFYNSIRKEEYKQIKNHILCQSVKKIIYHVSLWRFFEEKENRYKRCGWVCFFSLELRKSCKECTIKQIPEGRNKDIWEVCKLHRKEPVQRSWGWYLLQVIKSQNEATVVRGMSKKERDRESVRECWRMGRPVCYRWNFKTQVSLDHMLFLALYSFCFQGLQ